MNLNQLFERSRVRAPDKIAVEFATADRAAEISYGQLFEEAAAMARGLYAAGVRKGDRVAFFLGNRPEFVTAYLGVISVGAVMVPINLAYRRRELSYIVADAEPAVFLTETGLRRWIEEVPSEAREGLVILDVEELAAGGDVDPPATEIASGDAAMMLYTSGTTGQSKGAVISHENVIATVAGLLTAWRWEEDDRLLLTLPLFHTHGLVVGLHCALAAGATIHLRERFVASSVVAELVGGVATLFFGVPTLYQRIVAELEGLASRPDLSGMRLFCSGSAPLPPEVFTDFERLTGHTILERYGMTETGMLLSNPYQGRRIAGTVGSPLPGVSARIVDESDAEIPAGEEGELQVRGDNVFGGYWRAEEKTRASFCRDEDGREWFRTGDLARRDPETGHTTLLGRRHELIISGGYNIYPREVEEVLDSLASVREVAVAGRPHPDWGESPVAYVVLDGPLDEAQAIDHCKAHLAAFKVPRRFVIVGSLPRNVLGKVQKHLLPD